MASFAEQVIRFTEALQIPDIPLPDGFSWLYPYDQPGTMEALSAFYRKYYAAPGKRTFLFGINPGRLGAGLTGVPFTDPIKLEEECGIKNPFPKKPELSAGFVWRFIHAYGGPERFANDFYITSLSPLGFIKDGKNINYYDDKDLVRATEPFIVDCIEKQMAFGAHTKTALCMGEGKNLKVFRKINEKHRFFDEIIGLPHPRFVMQYRRKSLDMYLDVYLEALSDSLPTSK
jgi:hypothetical protein